MSQSTKSARQHRRLKVWQRLFLAVALLVLLFLSSTLFRDFSHTEEPMAAAGNFADTASAEADPDPSQEETYFAYVVADEGELTVPFYNEALAEKSRCGRGTYVQLESWEPFVAENGKEYYHVYKDGEYGYILCDNISDDRSDVVQETQVYVRTTTNLLTGPDTLTIGQLASKGDLLRIVGYDYILPNGKVNMYEVKLGTELGWIGSEYVTMTYAESLENWNNDENVYKTHVMRGDAYGGGDASELDYWPREKGDFAALGNVMPESCYALYISIATSTPEQIERYLEIAEGTAINTFVFTIFDDGELAYDSDWVDSYGILDMYSVKNTRDEFMESVRMVQEAGYYTVARITTFNDYNFTVSFPEWSITDPSGQPIAINGSYWPSVYCREVWEYKVGLAVEAVDLYGFNEVQFDYVRFPDYIQDYEEDGLVDLKNSYGESRAQAVQRFLMYACDVVHAHNAYVSADVFGETSNDYVAPYGQYWPAISNVVDVISGMPYPDHYSSYYTSTGLYSYYKHPYNTLFDWGAHVNLRQNECPTPAVVRTWVQTWDDYDYKYDSLAIQKQIVALFDTDITGGYMPWFGPGNLEQAEKLADVINVDYYALYLEAEAENMILSEYMGLDISE